MEYDPDGPDGPPVVITEAPDEQPPADLRCRNCAGQHSIQACPEVRAALMSDDAVLVKLMEIRQQIATSRKQGLSLIPETLRHEAMSLAEHYVDPEYEAAEQRAHDREWVARCNARTQALLADRQPGVPF
jgi:hypothetical protein